MKSPLATYNENKSKAGIIRGEFNKSFKNIYISGSEKKDGLGDIDEEKAILANGKFIPGKIYMFDYDPLYKDVLTYFDRKPIIFVHKVFKAEGTNNDIVTGVNLNFLPEEARIQALETFYQNFKSDITKSVEMAEEGKINMAINRIISFFNDWVNVLKVYNGSGGLGYQYAYRNYIIAKIKDLKYIEYNHWEMLPFLNPNFFTGLSVEEVHASYWTQQAILNKKIPK